MKKISTTTKGYYALVDNEDYDYLNQFTWSLDKGKRTYYARAVINGKNERMHRIIMKAKSGELIDHKDLNGLNNQRKNLRFCNHSQNAINRRAWGTSKYLGVYKRKTHTDYEYCWMAVINNTGIPKIIGRFNTERKAAIARDKVAYETYGEFARLNFPKRRI